MLGVTDYGTFVVTIIVFLLIPGPGNLALITSTSKGRIRGGLAATMGVIAGDQVLMWSAVAGVAALLAAYPDAFQAVQWLGAAYLAWLGAKMLLAKPGAAPVLNITAGHYFRQALMITLLNPKAILFYSAMIPQFADPSFGEMQRQLLVLGATFVTMQVLWDVSLMLGIVHFREALLAHRSSRFNRIMKNVCGITFISMALALLLHERPSTP